MAICHLPRVLGSGESKKQVFVETEMRQVANPGSGTESYLPYGALADIDVQLASVQIPQKASLI